MCKCTMRNREKTLKIKANLHIKHVSGSTLLIWCVLVIQRVHTPDPVYSTLTLDLSAEHKHIKQKQVQHWLCLYSCVSSLTGDHTGLRDPQVQNILVFHVQPDNKVCFIIWPHITRNGLTFWFCKDTDVCNCRQNSNHILTSNKVYSPFTSEPPELLLSSLTGLTHTQRTKLWTLIFLDRFNTDASPFK